MAFLRYLVSASFSGEFRCENNNNMCYHMLEGKVPALALDATRTYMMFAVNKDPCFLGLPCEENHHCTSNLIIADGELPTCLFLSSLLSFNKWFIIIQILRYLIFNLYPHSRLIPL